MKPLVSVQGEKKNMRNRFLSTEGQIQNTIYKMLYTEKIQYNILNAV